jgi:hypothetical protein
MSLFFVVANTIDPDLSPDELERIADYRAHKIDDEKIVRPIYLVNLIKDGFINPVVHVAIGR